MKAALALLRWSGSLGLASFLVGTAAGADERAFVDAWVSGALLREPGPIPEGWLAAPGGAAIPRESFPFSFTYGGKDSSQFLSGWKRASTALPAEDGKVRFQLSYTDPATGL